MAQLVWIIHNKLLARCAIAKQFLVMINVWRIAAGPARKMIKCDPVSAINIRAGTSLRVETLVTRVSENVMRNPQSLDRRLFLGVCRFEPFHIGSVLDVSPAQSVVGGE